MFSVQELLTYGTIYLLSQQTLAVCASFAHQLVQATCLDFVQFILSDAITVWTFSFSAYYKYRNMFIILISVLATSKWLSALCCLLNLIWFDSFWYVSNAREYECEN